jgi:hypothetical protein
VHLRHRGTAHATAANPTKMRSVTCETVWEPTRRADDRGPCHWAEMVRVSPQGGCNRRAGSRFSHSALLRAGALLLRPVHVACMRVGQSAAIRAAQQIDECERAARDPAPPCACRVPRRRSGRDLYCAGSCVASRTRDGPIGLNQAGAVRVRAVGCEWKCSEVQRRRSWSRPGWPTTWRGAVCTCAAS